VKLKHFVMIGFGLIGLLYVLHMVTQHQGSSILSGLSVTK